ncbi:MAG: hypothetical protein J7J96_08675 [Sulfurimonas sp.]|nr:hypothetical protein [Sulfurimonas sp.]
MMKLILLLFLFPHAMMADFDYRIENTNLSISQDSVIYNYDRLRFRGDYFQNNFFSTIIVDGVNYYGQKYINSKEFTLIQSIESDTPFLTASNFYNYDNGSAYSKIYRAYIGYEDAKNRVVFGLQNITMGVGRIWNPTNLFNPKNIYALEPDEVFGVFGVSYTRHINDTSHITVVASQKADDSFKYGARYKSYMSFVDIGFSLISSNQTKMLGYEIEGNLLDTGMEFRSEGAYIKNELKDFFQGIVGVDYGFVNGVTLVAEVLYSSENFSYQEILENLNSEIVSNLVQANFYTALSLSYSFNIFLDGSVLYIDSFDDKNSRFISPSLTYTLDDYNSFMIGAMVGDLKSRYYFKYLLSF